ncbi:MAG TPA: HAD family phosphatase [Pirellulaceae bacterium]|nr:HAD family phosphatase [Pirellulaceae bacterium]HMO91849.1 HAD family phosphatase [Pirellulaceae bacterium]HMP69741.1 HAD family phosphatase [Pirellulaceae bacterium]
MALRFVYLDLGNVIARFSHQRMVEQIAALLGCDSQEVANALFGLGWQSAYETGQLSTAQLVDRFGELAHQGFTESELKTAASNIFSLNLEILPLISQLNCAAVPLGILSNTCEAHWEWLSNRYTLLTAAFEVTVLSFQVGHAKPDLEIFTHAAQMANCNPQEIFFTDDRPELVRAASDCGLHAELFVSAKRLATSLRNRGLRFNY